MYCICVCVCFQSEEKLGNWDEWHPKMAFLGCKSTIKGPRKWSMCAIYQVSGSRMTPLCKNTVKVIVLRTDLYGLFLYDFE